MLRKLEECAGIGLVVLMAAVHGCQSYEAEDVANLQKQLSILVRQVEDMRKDVDALQGQEAETIQIEQALEAIEDEIDVLRSQLGQHAAPAPQAAVPLPTPTAPSLETEVLAAQSQPAKPAKPVVHRAKAHGAEAHTAKGAAKRTDCTPVWGLVGKGKTETEIAKLLNISLQAVQLCDEQIGKKK